MWQKKHIYIILFLQIQYPIMVKCSNIGKIIGTPIYWLISSVGTPVSGYWGASLGRPPLCADGPRHDWAAVSPRSPPSARPAAWTGRSSAGSARRSPGSAESAAPPGPWSPVTTRRVIHPNQYTRILQQTQSLESFHRNHWHCGNIPDPRTLQLQEPSEADGNIRAHETRKLSNSLNRFQLK